MFQIRKLLTKNAIFGQTIYLPNLIQPNVVRFCDVTNGTVVDELQKQRKMIENELYIRKILGKRTPNIEEITPKQWNELLSLTSQKSRNYQYYKLYERMHKKQKQTIINEQRKLKNIELKECVNKIRTENQHLVYAPGRNSMYLRFRLETINKWRAHKLHQAKLHGQKIVIDCSFSHKLNDNEQRIVAQQIIEAYNANRFQRQPFDMHLFGVDRDSVIVETLDKLMPKILDKNSPLSIHAECFTETLPKKNVVLLTPDSENDLEFNANDIYVVGGICEKIKPAELTLAKAKSFGLRAARFPLDRYIRFGEGHTKTLSINESVNILREFYHTRNWRTSLQNNIRNYKKLTRT